MFRIVECVQCEHVHTSTRGIFEYGCSTICVKFASASLALHSERVTVAKSLSRVAVAYGIDIAAPDSALTTRTIHSETRLSR